MTVYLTIYYIAGFERKLLTLMEEVKVQVNYNTKLLNALLRKVDTVNTVSEELMETDGEVAKLFPIQTQEDIWKCEDMLQDEDMSEKMVNISLKAIL